MSLTIEQFRSDPTRVDEWRQILAMPITREVLSTLRDNGPEFTRLGIGLSPIDVAVKVGHEHGYAEHHQHLEEMAERWPRKHEKLEEDYGAGPAPDDKQE